MKSMSARKLKQSLADGISEKTREAREQLLATYQWRHDVKTLLDEADAVLGALPGAAEGSQVGLHGT